MIDRIETVMRGDGRGRNPFWENFLMILSLGYGGAVKVRESLYKRGILRPERLPCPVISIGNLTLGGTGKTPMTLYVAQWLGRLGYRVTVLSRGYRGHAEKKGGVVSDGRRFFMGPDEAGDEPFMMGGKLRNVPVIVGKDRYGAGRLAHERFAPDVMILDDGFQHLRLFRDLDLVLLDGRRPFGNTHLFPRGILREPVSALRRADACIFTRSDRMTPVDQARVRFLSRRLPVFTSLHIPQVYRCAEIPPSASVRNMPAPLKPWDSDRLKDRMVFAFSGIADNDDFRRTVESLCPGMKGFRGFPDHHRYTEADLNRLLNQAKGCGADTLVTTEKDYARIGHRLKWTGALGVIGIQTSFGADTDAFTAFIRNRLSMMNT